MRDEINTLQTKNLVPYNQLQAGHSLAYSVATARKTYQCKLCKQEGHNWSRCPTYDTNQKRIERAKVTKLCLRCLSDKHFGANCEAKWLKPCFNCGILHLTMLCYKEKEIKPQNGGNKKQARYAVSETK